MTILSWFFIGSFSVCLITFFISLFSFVLFFVTSKDLEHLKQKRPKNKRKKKRWLSATRRLKRKKKVQLRRGIMLIILSILFISVGSYARYYEITNLSSTDGNIIVQSYFITDEVKKELVRIQEGKDSAEAKEKIMELSSLLTSYGSSTPSNSLGKEGQRTLNRYYVQLREYGTNLYSLTPDQLTNQETITTYLDDLQRIKQTQKKLFKQFSVDEAALKQKK